MVFNIPTSAGFTGYLEMNIGGRLEILDENILQYHFILNARFIFMEILCRNSNRLTFIKELSEISFRQSNPTIY